VSLGTGKYALDVTPHAGLGFGGAGGSAEAGATVRFGKKMGNQVVNSLGVATAASSASADAGTCSPPPAARPSA
jgi:hypothetical protein